MADEKDIYYSSGRKILYPPPINPTEDENVNLGRRRFLKIGGAIALSYFAFKAGSIIKRTSPSYVDTDTVPTYDLTSYLKYRGWILDIAKKHFNFLLEMSGTYDVPPELIMGTISSRMFFQNKITEFEDNLKLFFYKMRFCSDPGIGFGQMRVRTALYLNNLFGVNNRSEKETIERLMDIEGAMEYISMYYANISRIFGLDNLNKYAGDPHSIVYLYATYIGGSHPNMSAIFNGLGITGMLKRMDLKLDVHKDYKQDLRSLFDVFGNVNGFDRAGLVDVYDEFSRQINQLFGSQSTDGFTTPIENMLRKDMVPSNLKGNTYYEKRQYLLDYIEHASDVSLEKYHNYLKSKARHSVNKRKIKRISAH